MTSDSFSRNWFLEKFVLLIRKHHAVWAKFLDAADEKNF